MGIVLGGLSIIIVYKITKFCMHLSVLSHKTLFGFVSFK